MKELDRMGEKEKQRRREGKRLMERADSEKRETKSETERDGRRQMPRGRSERGRMMETNGEWQLRD